MAELVDPFAVDLGPLVVTPEAPDDIVEWLLEVCLRFVNGFELLRGGGGGAREGVRRMDTTYKIASPFLEPFAREMFPQLFTATPDE